MKNNNDFIYLSDTKLRYIGDTNEYLEQDKLYTGNFLIFPKATLCYIAKGSGAHNKSFQTLTKNWESLDGRQITEMGGYKEY